MRSLLRFDDRLLDLIWAGLYLTLALWFLRESTRLGDLQSAVFFGSHLLIAWLFLSRRRPVLRCERPAGYLVAVGSTLYIFLFDLQPSSGDGAELGSALTLLGSLGCLASIGSLGRCWGVLPICRGVETRWLYRVVRHPIYATYLLMDLGILLAHPSVWNVLVLGVGSLLYLARIRYEEELLGRLEVYRTYCSSVRFRLLPLVY